MTRLRKVIWEQAASPPGPLQIHSSAAHNRWTAFARWHHCARSAFGSCYSFQSCLFYCFTTCQLLKQTGLKLSGLMGLHRRRTVSQQQQQQRDKQLTVLEGQSVRVFAAVSTRRSLTWLFDGSSWQPADRLAHCGILLRSRSTKELVIHDKSNFSQRNGRAHCNTREGGAARTGADTADERWRENSSLRSGFSTAN